MFHVFFAIIVDVFWMIFCLYV